MSYYNLNDVDLTPEARIGRKIYMEALHGRRGFREDQLGIFDEDIWVEIFEHIGTAARTALNLSAEREIEAGEETYTCPECSSNAAPHIVSGMGLRATCACGFSGGEHEFTERPMHVCPHDCYRPGDCDGSCTHPKPNDEVF